MKKLKKGLTIALLTVVTTVFLAGMTTANVEAATAAPKLNKTSVSIKEGQKSTLSATVNGKKVTKVTWKTSNKNIATVSTKGVVTAKKAGSAKITAKVNGKTVTCKVSVKKVAATKINAAPKLNKTSVSIKEGQKSTLSATVNGKKVTKVTWKTSNKNIATVSTKGVVTAKKAGSAKITAKVNGKTVTCKVSVAKKAATTNTTSLPLDARAKKNATTYKQFINDVVKYTNEYRVKNGRKAITLDNTLTTVACYRSIEMADKDVLSHTRPDGSKFYDLAKKYGVTYTFVGENIGAYQMSAKEIVDAWYNSAGHRANMLSANYTKIGVGVGVTSDGYYFWTQIFKN